MKKLVTIVSAVMMLLMLAACAPTMMSPDAEQKAAIKKADLAATILEAYIQTEGANEATSPDVDFSADEDIVVDSFEVKAATSGPDATEAYVVTDLTIKKGSTYSVKTTGTDTKTTVTSVDVELSWTQEEENEDKETVEVSYSVSVSYEGSYSVVTTGDNTGDTSFKCGPYYIDGTPFEPYYAPWAKMV